MGLSAKNKDILLGPLSKKNPVVVQMLGIGGNGEAGTFSCDGSFGSGDCCIFVCCYIIDKKYGSK